MNIFGIINNNFSSAYKMMLLGHSLAHLPGDEIKKLSPPVNAIHFRILVGVQQFLLEVSEYEMFTSK